MKRSVPTVVGVILVVLGILGLTMERIPYEREEADLEIGDLEASATVQEEVRVPPLAAGAVLAVGAGLIVFGVARRKS